MDIRDISYRGEIFELGHLRQSFKTFAWRTREDTTVTFSVRVRFSDHCISREIKLPDIKADDDVTVGENPLRVFCPERHSCTSMLVGIIDGLIKKPGTSVGLTTTKRNWHTFQIYISPEHGAQQRYCCFFTLKKPHENLRDELLPLDLYVESAYPRGERVGIIKNMPFGKVAELTWNGERYF